MNKLPHLVLGLLLVLIILRRTRHIIAFINRSAGIRHIHHHNSTPGNGHNTINIDTIK